MFERKNQTEENSWLLNNPFCKLYFILKVNISKLKFILLFFYYPDSENRRQGLFRTTWLKVYGIYLEIAQKDDGYHLT